METGRPHQNSLSSFPRTEVTKKSFTKDTIPKSPLLFYTPVKPSFQLVKKEDGEGHTSIAKENTKATENLRINGANVHNSTCSTPIKTPFGTPSQLQTPISKLSFLSASGHKHSVGAGGCGVNEDASITRTPFRLLAGKNLNACLFSPSHTPRPIAFPSPFDKLFSPALKGHAKRVFVIPSPLSPARRVPVKQKGSQLTKAGKQSPFATPKSSRVNNVPFATPKSCRVDNVPFATPKSSRVDNILKAAGQNDDGNVNQHSDVHNVEVNYDKQNLEGSALAKRVLAFMPQQSPFATPNSSRVEHALKAAHQNNGVSEGNVMRHQDADGTHDREKLDRLELLKRVFASMPQPPSRARRVPLRQKQKQPIKTPSPLHHKEKQQSSSNKSLPETPKTCKSEQRGGNCQSEAGVPDAKRQAAGKQKQPIKIPSPLHHKEKQQSTSKKTPKTCKSGQRGGKTCQNEAGVVPDTKRQAAGNHQNATKNLQKWVPKGKGGDGADKTKQLSVDNHKIKSGSSKQHDDGSHQNATKKLQKRVPKGKGGNGTDKAKQLSVDNHKIKSGSSKQHDDDINKKYRYDCVNDVNQHCEDGKLHEACDVDAGRDDAKQYHDAEFGGNNAKQHDDEDGTKNRNGDLGEDGKRQFEDGSDDEKQHEACHVDVSGDDNLKEHDGDGSKHFEDGNGTKQHDDDDDDIGVGSDDTDGKKQHSDDDAAKQHNHANGVKQHNHDGTKQHNDDDADVEIGGEEAECMKQDDALVDICRDDDDGAKTPQ